MLIVVVHLDSYLNEITTGVPLKQRKQIFLNEHNKVKNPNWQEADQLAVNTSICYFDWSIKTKHPNGCLDKNILTRLWKQVNFILTILWSLPRSG